MTLGPRYDQPPLPFTQTEFIDPVSKESLGFVEDFKQADTAEEYDKSFRHWKNTLMGHQEALTAKYGKVTTPRSEPIGRTVALYSSEHLGEQFQATKKTTSVNPGQMHLPNTSPAELDELSKGWEPTHEQRQSHLASERALQKTPVSVERLWEANEEERLSGQIPFEGLMFRSAHHDFKHDKHRMEQARKMFPVVPSESPRHQTRKETIARAIYDSSIPTDAFSALSASINIDSREGRDGGARHNSMLLHKGMLDKSEESSSYYGGRGRPQEVITHELGHVVDFRSNKGTHVGVKGDKSRIFYPDGTQVYDQDISPAGEGFADGIELRFSQWSRSPRGSKDPLHTDFSDGYDPNWWSDPAHQASYLAHRAMAWTEGGRPHVSNEGELGTAEAVHIAGRNPHVRAAIRQNNLTSMARSLSNQFMKTKHAGTQLSLLGDEYNTELYSVPDVDWDAE